MELTVKDDRIKNLLRSGDKDILQDIMDPYRRKMEELIRRGYEKLAADRGASLVDTVCRYRPEISTERVLTGECCWTFQCSVKFRLREEQVQYTEDILELLEMQKERG